MTTTPKKRGLGRGLDAIFGDITPTQQSKPMSEMAEVAIADIYPNPLQPRTEFDEEALAELADSIAQLGVIQPITLKRREDGKYTIQSLADGKYWSNNIDEDGWGAGSATLYKTSAAKVSIEPNNNDGLPNSFVIYWYQEDDMRDGEPHPYIIFQDWGDNIGTISVKDLKDNDKDGQGEWYIYKMTMDTPYYFWLKNLVAAAEAMGLVKSNDPGYYKELGTFPEALAAAQAAIKG